MQVPGYAHHWRYRVAMCGFGADFVNIGILNNDHAGAACCLVTVVADCTLGNRAVLIIHTGRLGSLCDAVFKFKGTDFAGLKQIGKHFLHG